MARTNYHKRIVQNYARKPATKSPRDRILIVCEGERDEPQYFESLCNDRRLSVITDVKICGKECGSAPSSVYKYAIDSLKRSFKDVASDDYDRAYCVFDRDSHTCYAKTLSTIQRNPTYKADGKEAKLIAINSVPCFEFWILLHFKLTDAPLQNSSEVEKSIKREWAAYSKIRTKDVYPYLKDKTETAIKNAKTILKNSLDENPSTRVHILVEDLIKQSKIS